MTTAQTRPGGDPAKIARRAQAMASKPDVSSWVSASAGTGKTFVLTQRVLRLLLSEAKPERILCLTFTKAAAAEMTNRIASRLGEWALLDNAALRKDLTDLTGRPPDKAEIDRARTLFATCLDVPAGMRIQTIHAFCQALLKRFPLEAGIPPHFQVIEEGDQRELLNQVRNNVLAQAAPGTGRFADDLATLTTVGGPDELTSLLGEFLGHRGKLRRHLKDQDSLDRAIDQLYAQAGLSAATTDADLVADACAEGRFDRDGLRSAITALESGSAKDQDRAAKIADWLSQQDAASRAAGFDTYASVFLTAKLQPAKNLATKSAEKHFADLQDVMRAECDRVAAVFDGIKQVRLLARSAALARLGGAVHQRYEAAKAYRAALDFDDLILKAEDLLTSRDATPWVLFKLDGGIDHILVDEAQDTSPDQWRLVESIAREFFAGSGVERPPAEDGLPLPPRTIFAVGDSKQSIYSFQGADPAVFGDVRQEFGQQVRDAAEEWAPVDLDTSFRSVQPVLDVVDSTFGDGAARDGVVDGDETLHHLAFRRDQGGMVELWPLIVPEETPPPERWTVPKTEVESESPNEVLARRIAGQIRAWLDGEGSLAWDGSVSPPAPRRVQASDVMILVRRRTDLVEALIRSLKVQDIDVAGADRMALIEQLAVQDVLALTDFLLLPEDDLTLATVLKGPLFGFDDDQLFNLAYARKGASLWSRLSAAKDPASASAYAALRSLRADVDYTPPYELLKKILTGEGAPSGREMFWSRLGPDALEPLEELLNLALIYQTDHPPSLQGFLQWLRGRNVDIKRDMESVPNAVRIMTVHGSKGLQAPIVILPDTIRLPRTSDRFIWPAGGGRDSAGLPLITPSSDDADARSADLKAAAVEAQRREYNRLLYVAMTRAENALVVCGARGKTKADDKCWHELVTTGLRRLDGTAEREVEGFDEPVLRYGHPGPDQPPSEPAAIKPAEEDLLPALLTPPPKESHPPTPLAPSRPDEAEPAIFGPFDNGANRFRRGAIIHQLLQHLPDIPAADRARVAAQFLSRPSHGLTKDEQDQIAAETLDVLNLPDAQMLFGDASIAEAPITGIVGETVISGQIDRLAIGDDAIAIVDYKTNRPPPTDPAATPAVYLRQMAAYRALLQRLYPGKAINCFLLWTAIPHLTKLDPGHLDSHTPVDN